MVRPLEESLATVFGVRRIRTRIIRGSADLSVRRGGRHVARPPVHRRGHRAHARRPARGHPDRIAEGDPRGLSHPLLQPRGRNLALAGGRRGCGLPDPPGAVPRPRGWDGWKRSAAIRARWRSCSIRSDSRPRTCVRARRPGRWATPWFGARWGASTTIARPRGCHRGEQRDLRRGPRPGPFPSPRTARFPSGASPR